mmetsp:Transcript_6464/g.22753  ORF Transcript_6464/g.22753 Transcript_6464/m.22753 type:complete len:202 (+) Transcript_6464:493-1098(+)
MCSRRASTSSWLSSPGRTSTANGLPCTGSPLSVRCSWCGPGWSGRKMTLYSPRRPSLLRAASCASSSSSSSWLALPFWESALPYFLRASSATWLKMVPDLERLAPFLHSVLESDLRPLELCPAGAAAPPASDTRPGTEAPLSAGASGAAMGPPCSPPSAGRGGPTGGESSAGARLRHAAARVPGSPVDCSRGQPLASSPRN